MQEGAAGGRRLGCLDRLNESAGSQAQLSAPVLTFEVASIKPASPSVRSFQCQGGPGTADPGTWSCSNVPLVFLDIPCDGFQPPQFLPIDSCCQARFDIAAKVPAGTTPEQFRRMQQNLLEQRLKLTFHHERKEMPIYELAVGEKGSKLKESAPDAALAPEDQWASPEYTMGKDGYPVFPAGHGGLAGGDGHYRWTAVNVPTEEIAKTLAYHLGRPVVRRHRSQGKVRHQYDLDHRSGLDHGKGRHYRRAARHGPFRPDPSARRPGSTRSEADIQERPR